MGENPDDTEGCFKAGKANLGDSLVVITAVWSQEDCGCVSVPGNGGGGICSYNKMSLISHDP